MLGKAEALRENMIDILSTRLGEFPAELLSQLEKIEDLPQLRALLKQAVLVDSVAHFEAQVAQALDYMLEQVEREVRAEFNDQITSF